MNEQSIVIILQYFIEKRQYFVCSNNKNLIHCKKYLKNIYNFWREGQPMKKIFIVFLLLILFLTGIFIWSRPKEEFVFKIEQTPVYKEEFSYYLQQEKNNLFVKYNITSVEKVTEDAMKEAREAALNKCIEDKSILILAKEKGLINEISQEAINWSWKNFVGARKKTVEAGGIVYGPVEMEYSDYRRYLVSNLKIQIMDVYLKENPISDSEIEKFYEDNKKEVFQQSLQLCMNVISIDSQEDEKASTEELLEYITQIKSGSDIKDVELRNETKAQREEYRTDELSSKGYLNTISPLLEACTDLQVGDVSDVRFDSSFGYFIVQLSDVKEGRVMELEEVRNRISDILITEEFEQYVKDRVDNFTIDMNSELFDRMHIN